MPTMPDGMSGFEMEPNAYDVDRVALEVIWPLVDYAWHAGRRSDNWLEDTKARDSVTTFGRKTIEGQEFRVVLEACADYTFEDDEETLALVRSATIKVEETARGDAREVLMNRALVEVEKADKAIREAGHGDAPSAWPEGEDDEIAIKTVRTYEFNCSGDWGDPHVVAVEGLDKRIEISFDNRNESIDYEMRLHDVEAIEVACRVLSAPKAIMKAIQNIKHQPVASC